MTIDTALSFKANIGNGELHVTCNDLDHFLKCITALGLAQGPGASAPAAAPAAEEKPVKAPKAAKAPATPAPAPAPEPEAPVAEPAPAQVTPAEAAAAIRAYGSKHGIDAAKALLTRLGFSKTSEITADKAQWVAEQVAQADL